MNDNPQLTKLLTALCKSMNLIHWIGAYAHGRTENGDPFILLFSSNEKMEHKICRVYEGDFKKLPPFIKTQVPTQATSANPDRGKLKASGKLFTCPAFQIVCYEGRETQMGKERRFSDTLYVPRSPQSHPEE